MGVSIGPKIGIDGEAAFRKQIKDINSAYKSLEEGTKAVTAAFEANGNKQGALEAAQSRLEQQMLKQIEKYDLLKDAVSRATQKYGENSAEAAALEGALYDTENTIRDLERQILDTDDALAKLADGMGDAASETDAAEAEFQSSLSSIKAVDTHLKALEAETKAVTAAFEANGDKQGALEATASQLLKQLDKQREKLKLLETALQQATDQYGEGSVEAIQLNTALHNTKTTIGKLETEVTDTINKLERMSAGLDDVADEADDAGNAMLDFGDILNANIISDFIMDGLQELGDLVVDFAKGMPEAAAEVRAAESQFEQAFGEMENSARSALESISEDTGIATTRLQESYTQIYAFAKTAGAESEVALDIAGRALVAAADNAAYYDKSIEDVTETLQSFLKGNYENDAALGVSCTETTRNAAANELYAQSFNDLSESQKQLTLLYMVEQANELSGAMGQAAREADSWTNTTGELAEAWRQLQAALGDPVLEGITPLLQAFTQILNDLSKTLASDELADGMKSFEKSVDSANKTLESSEKEIERTAIAADYYVGKLEELESQVSGSESAQQEYANVVKALNELYPELNLQISEQTGLLDANSRAQLNNLSALKQKYLQQAQEAQYTSILQAQAEATVAVQNAQYQLTQVQGQRVGIETQLASILGVSAERARELAYQYVNGANGTVAFTNETAALAVELVNLIAEEAALEEGIESGNLEIEEAEALLKELAEALGLTTDGTGELTEATDDSSTSLKDLAKAYEDTQESARDSIEFQMGLFDELSMESEMSAREIVDNWAKQQQALENYKANLQKAIDMNLDKALVQQLSDGSTQSMVILDELVNGTEVHVDEINAAFRNLENAKEEVAGAIAGTSNIIEAELDEAESAAYAGGANVADATARGISDNTYKVSQAASRMAGTIQPTYNKILDIRSPSRKMEKSAEYTVDGAVVGVDENIKRFEESMRAMAKAGENAFLQERLESASLYPSIVTNPVAAQQSRSYTYGDIIININQLPGEDAEELAYRIMDVIQIEVAKREAGVSG